MLRNKRERELSWLGERDERGTGDSAYVAAKILREKREMMTAAKCNKFLTRFGTTSTLPVEGRVRYRKPNRKALEIHAADWLKFWEEVDRRRSDALDEPGIQEFLTNVEAEKSKIKATKKRGRASSPQLKTQKD